MRWLALLLLVAPPLPSQMTTPTIVLHNRAHLTLDSIAALARHEELEPGACVTQFTATKDTIVILAIEKGDLMWRQRGSLRWNGKMCHDSLPSLHGHLLHLGHWEKPSPMDWVLAVDTVRKKALFHLILVVDEVGAVARLIPYGVKIP